MDCEIIDIRSFFLPGGGAMLYWRVVAAVSESFFLARGILYGGSHCLTILYVLMSRS